MIEKKTDNQTLVETMFLVETKGSTQGNILQETDKWISDNKLNVTTIAKEIQNRHNIEEVTMEIIRHKGNIVNSFIQIGRLLIEAKTKLSNGHGYWIKWLHNSIDISERMAQRYMQLAEEYENTTSVTDLGMTKALALLALSSEEREAFINESHIINGKEKKISDMSTRELKNAIRMKQENSNQSDDSYFLKPITRNDFKNKSTAFKLESQLVCNSLNDFATNLKFAHNYLDYILDYMEKEVQNPETLDKYADELRSLYKKTLECISLVRVEIL